MALWWRKNPSACPYSQRFWVEAPHPLITRDRLREILEPQPGERVLEIGPGTGYYTLDLAEWVGRRDDRDLRHPAGDARPHDPPRPRARACERQAHAGRRPGPRAEDDDSFDAAILITVLGEIPDQDAALREVARVLKPGGRLVVGELVGDPHYVTLGSLERQAEAAGLRFERRAGPKLGYFARFRA